jgi:hypothetical protein
MAMVTRMSVTGQSILDQSSSEKIQLVEDLWDDFAGRPKAVPVAMEVRLWT